MQEWCRPLFDDERAWQELRGAITGIDNRNSVVMQIERKDGSVLNCMTMPLPDGATLLTFQDVTDTVNVERALRERNEALEAADTMKVNFVHHVSYELRSPLTTIIGFAHFLSDPSTGPLTLKQSEYLSYITSSTNALLAIINNILDLATIDAGAMSLSLGPVDVRKAIEQAAAGVQDRLATDNIHLDVEVSEANGAVRGRRAARRAGALQSARQRRRLFAAGRHRHLDRAHSTTAARSSRSPTRALAFRRKARTRCSTGSKPTPTARAIAAPDLVSRWFARSSRCMAATSRSISVVGRGTTVICDFPAEPPGAAPPNDAPPGPSRSTSPTRRRPPL